MRVLHVIDSLGQGGAEQLLVTTLPELREQGVTPLVAVLRGPYTLQSDLEALDIRVIRVPAFHKWNLLAGRAALGKICAEEDIDLVHAHLYFPGLYAGLLGETGTRPMFETFHNLAYAGANRGGPKLVFRKYIRALVAKRSRTKFLAVSEAVAAHYAQALSLSDVTPLPNSVDFAEIDRVLATRRELTGANQTLKLVLPGRLVPEKGHGDLLDALALGDLPEFTLKFLGGGPEEAALREKAATLAVPLNISGLISHQEFLSELADADICVAPSRFEGFGIAAAEAMALGVATIASDAGGLPEVVGDAGIVIPVANPEALYNAIGRLAEDPAKRRRLGVAGAARVRDRFSSQATATKLAKMYREAIAK